MENSLIPNMINGTIADDNESFVQSSYIHRYVIISASASLFLIIAGAGVLLMIVICIYQVRKRRRQALEIVNEYKHKQNKTDNLTRRERKALNELINNPTLIINKVDKGSTIVVQDRSDYITEAMKHLADRNTYKKLQENITYELKEVIYTKLEIPYKNGFLLINWYQFCKPPQNHRTSKLYFLKKIRINPMGIHPIVSSCDSITEKMSQLVDRWLQPYVISLPSYVKDTTKFINQIEQLKPPTNNKLASIDVSSLYTNIPHEEGVQSVLHFLTNHKESYKHPEQSNPEVL